MLLSNYLDIAYEELVSLKLDKKYAPIGHLIQSQILSKIPFHIFGLKERDIIDLLVNEPLKGSAFVQLVGKMAKNQLIHIAKYAIAMAKGLEENQELESWVQSKITLAEDYISKVKHYLETELQVDFHDPDIDNLLQNEEPEPEEKKN